LKGELRHGGQRVSRHYYDVFQLAKSDLGKQALENKALGIDCARHAQLFFYSASFDLEHAVPGTLTIVPPVAMMSTLQRDYQAMSGMIFGEVPSFEEILQSLANLEESINSTKQ
ncbi:MAG: nucleotidyl transferase AbiEii/AbiGii toxin family protein, partial [Chthoniobacterales bacterium]|nr:nucleotidyl transferase AbiEii/AbiGii toxin family protein [Chthoniobacterales bacterium]